MLADLRGMPVADRTHRLERDLQVSRSKPLALRSAHEALTTAAVALHPGRLAYRVCAFILLLALVRAGFGRLRQLGLWRHRQWLRAGRQIPRRQGERFGDFVDGVFCGVSGHGVLLGQRLNWAR
ncbi:hypothetical protein ASF16_06855 [Acidovorax sp. Leaf78]|nr:hypothetical protein ASF16_06855 [Acidovorax sp. Leaf78]